MPDYAVAPLNHLRERHAQNPAPYGDAIQAICGSIGCSNHEEIADPSGSYTTFTKAAAKFARQGWTIGKTQLDFRCPTCIANARKQKPKEPIKVVNMTAAVQPKQPTREQWANIVDALDAYYDIPHARYRDNYSDKRVAEEVGVGFAYVAEERNRRYGEHDRNEASDEQRKAVQNAVALASSIEGDLALLKAAIAKIAA